jgi:cysteine desulfurase / selenocysteine lyase
MTAAHSLDVKRLRKDFPMLSRTMSGHPLVYLDNAASTQKPQVVLDRLQKFYSQEYSNIHRGVYTFSQDATRLVNEAREKCRTFLNAASA